MDWVDLSFPRVKKKKKDEGKSLLSQAAKKIQSYTSCLEEAENRWTAWKSLKLPKALNLHNVLWIPNFYELSPTLEWPLVMQLLFNNSVPVSNNKTH